MDRFQKQIDKTEDKHTSKVNNIPYRKRNGTLDSAVCGSHCGGNKQELMLMKIVISRIINKVCLESKRKYTYIL